MVDITLMDREKIRDYVEKDGFGKTSVVFCFYKDGEEQIDFGKTGAKGLCAKLEDIGCEEIRRREYDDEIVSGINNALAEYNRKYCGRRCAFIYQSTKNKLSLGFVLSDTTALSDALGELMYMAGISGKTEQEEITVRALDRLAHMRFRNEFEFDSDDLYALGIRCLTNTHYPPEEKIAREYTYDQLKRSAELGLYDESFEPEIERIVYPAAVENAKGHPCTLYNTFRQSSEGMRWADRYTLQIWKAQIPALYRFRSASVYKRL